MKPEFLGDLLIAASPGLVLRQYCIVSIFVLPAGRAELRGGKNLPRCRRNFGAGRRGDGAARYSGHRTGIREAGFDQMTAEIWNDLIQPGIIPPVQGWGKLLTGAR